MVSAGGAGPQAVPAPGCVLGEGPLWNPVTEEFFWTDIVNGVIYAWAVGAPAAREVLRTRYQTGAFLFDERCNLVLFTEEGVLLSRRQGTQYSAEPRLLWSVPMRPGERFNDAICDPFGRLLAGTKCEDNENGTLYRFARGREPEALLFNLNISNGMGFSPDGSVFYHTDSGSGTIFAYQYAREGGIASPHTVFTAPPPAVPDGMTVDAQGNLWAACWGGGYVVRLSPGGAVLEQYPFAEQQVSSVCFGGRELQDLFVTTASIGLSAGQPGGGCYVLRPGARGRDEYRAEL